MRGQAPAGVPGNMTPLPMYVCHFMNYVDEFVQRWF